MGRIEDLRVELDAGHPVTGAYDPDDALAADQINVVNQERNRNLLTGDELFGVTSIAELNALSDVDKQLWVSTCGRDVDPFSTANVTFVIDLFGVGSATVIALNDIRTEDVSRAVLLNLGLVRTGTVKDARAL